MNHQPEGFASAFRSFLDDMRAQAPPIVSPLRQRLQELFGLDPSSLALVGEQLPNYDLPNVQLAIERVLVEQATVAQAIGIVPDFGVGADLGNSIVSPANRSDVPPPREGPMTYLNVHLDGDRVLPCARLGVYLIHQPGLEHAFFIAFHDNGVKQVLNIQVMAKQREMAVQILGAFVQSMRDHDVYQGHVLTVTATFMEGARIDFARMPVVCREDVILPEGIMERLERQTIQFSQQADRLRASGFHMKRGMLLYGPPGTGKTLTTMYLASVAKGRTVILLFGQQFSSMADACAVARRLQPSVVIMEDVDMIAEDRETRANSLLHDLLNAMDGLEGDADIQFVLTTNRAEVLERALRTRPGRIDLAVEIPLPDAACRRRILTLFCAGVRHEFGDFSKWVARTEGASATFLRELVRRAALAAALEGSEIQLLDRHFEAACQDLLEVGGELNRNLLGFARAPET